MNASTRTNRLSWIAASFYAVCATGGFAQEPMQPSKPLQVLMANDVKDFFETAASGNMFEIEAAKVATKKATDPALKKFADKMLTDHSKAGTELKALASKKGVTLPTKLLKRHQMMLDGLREETVGEDFDEEYRDKMILSHKETVSLFDQAAKDSEDPDVKAFAAKTLPTLQKHGGMAEELPEKD